MIRAGLLIASALWIGFAPPLPACQVPVFRYALERWWPDPYQLVVVHNGDLTPEQASLLKPFEEYSDALNLEVEIVNLADADPKVLERYHGIVEAKTTPSLHLYYPDAPRGEPPVYTSPFTKDALDRIIDSPGRRQIASRILKGDSAVWIVLDGGTKDAGKEESRLRNGLKELAGYMELPEGVITPDEADKLMEKARAGEAPPPGFDFENVLNYGVPLRLGFSVIRVDTDDENEAAFVRMLLAADPDLDPAASPVAIPVFGRGRMLPGIPVKTLLDEDILPDACYYICGACSCQVKGQNPGLDLLMKVDWESVLEGHTVVIEKELPPLTGAGDLVSAGHEREGSQPPDHGAKDATAGNTAGPDPKSIPVSEDPPTGASTHPSPAPNPQSEKVPDEKPAVAKPIYFWFAAAVGGAILAIAVGSFSLFRHRR